MLAPLIALATIFAVAVGLWTSALNVKYRDVRYALPFVVQIWMYLTPVIYPISFLPPRWRWAVMLNPLSGIIEGFRAAIFNQPFDWRALAVAAAITLRLTGLCGNGVSPDGTDLRGRNLMPACGR